MVFMQEANVMRYIATHTTIPIPSIIDAIPVDTGAFIVMTRMPGKQPGIGLLTMSPQERSLLATDLKNCFDQLWSLPAPSSGPRICGFGGGTFQCFRIAYEHIGPFATEREFYRFLYEHVYLNERSRLEQSAHKVHSTPHRLCLTHNDLTPHNVLVDKNNRLSAIIDWECATWLPDYWDYPRSWYHRDIYYERLHLMDEVFGL